MLRPGFRARRRPRFTQGDLPTDALALDDADDAWWAGAQQCFAAIPIAGAVAAVALSASLAWGAQQQPEEVPSVSSGPIASDLVILPIQAPEFIVTPWWPDEVPQPPPLPAVPEDEGAWRLPVVVTESRVELVQIGHGQTDPVDLPPAAALDEGAWLPSSSPPQPQSLASWVPDDLPPRPLAVDEGEWLPSASALAPRLGVPWVADDSLGPQVAAVDEEVSWRPAVFVTEPRVEIVSIGHGQTDPVTPAATIQVDDEGAWRIPVFLTDPRVEMLQIGHGQTDPSASTPPPLHIVEDAWLPPVVLDESFTVLVGVQHGQGGADPPALVTPLEEFWWSIELVGRTPLPQPWEGATDERVTPAAVSVPHEVYLWTPPPAQPKPCVTVWTLEDERVPVAPAEEHLLWQGPPPAPLPIVTVWRVEDELVPVAPTISVSEEYWWSAPPQPERSAQPYLDDEIVPGAVAFAGESETWSDTWVETWWPQWVPVPPVVTVWATNDERVDSAPAEETFFWQAPPPAPLPAKPAIIHNDVFVLPLAATVTADDYWWRTQWIVPPIARQPIVEEAATHAQTFSGYLFRADPSRVFTVDARRRDFMVPADPTMVVPERTKEDEP